MKTYKIVLILGGVTFFFMGLAFYNLVLNNKRSFTLINISNYNMCFLVSSDYELEKTELGFKYKLKNNYGEFKVLNRPMSSDLVTSMVGEVKAGYKKLKNDRIFEYQLDKKTILKDTFYIIKKRQTYLVPLKSKCSELLKKYPVVMEL